MTIVFENQVKTISAEITEQFGHPVEDGVFDPDVIIEDVVRSVIAQYDISNIERSTA